MLESAVFDLPHWLAQLETLQGSTISLSLEKVRKVASSLNVLHFTCPVVTVAGTNGKGSTVATLAWLLTRQGLNVGSYTSPHLTYFQERIQINGIPVSDQSLSAALAKVESVRESIPLTYFEWATLAALLLFKHNPTPLDVLVLEIGLGGRLDAVNIVDPTLAIVTSIGEDHQAWLGHTLEAIAAEKAGIFRPNIPAVIGRTATQFSLLEHANNLKMKLMIEGQDFDIQSSGEWVSRENKFLIPENGLPKSSVSLALAAYTILEKQLCNLMHLNSPVLALRDVSMIGRFSKIRWKDKIIILDAAHNVQGAEWLAHQMMQKEFSNVIAVWASLQDKALSGIVKAMKPVVKHWMLGRLSVARASSDTQLQKALSHAGVKKHEIFESIQGAFLAALGMNNPVIVVFGSFYTVAEALSVLGLNQCPLPYHGLVSCMTEGYLNHG